MVKGAVAVDCQLSPERCTAAAQVHKRAGRQRAAACSVARSKCSKPGQTTGEGAQTAAHGGNCRQASSTARPSRESTPTRRHARAGLLGLKHGPPSSKAPQERGYWGSNKAPLLWANGRCSISSWYISKQTRLVTPSDGVSVATHHLHGAKAQEALQRTDAACDNHCTAQQGGWRYSERARLVTPSARCLAITFLCDTHKRPARTLRAGQAG